MKKRIISSFSSFLLIATALLLNFDLSAFASSGSGRGRVGKNSVMMQAEVGITRSGADDFATVRVDSVFPVGSYETDNYTQCLTRLYHNTIGNTPVSETFKLREGVGGQGMAIPFYEWYRSIRKFDLCFAGNDPDLEAWIIYTYDGR